MMWKKKTTDLKKKSPNLKNKLDTVFSRFIRLRDARKDGTFQCISCGRILPLDSGGLRALHKQAAHVHPIQ